MAATRPLRTRKGLIIGLVGLALCLVAPQLGLGRMAASGGDLHSMLVREAVVWAITGAVVLYVLVVERRPLSSIGFRRPGLGTLGFGFCGGVLLTAMFVFVAVVVVPALHLRANAGAMVKLVETPFWFRLLLVTRAAVTEEILYRAYPIERTGELSGSRILAALVSIAAFTYAHLSYWGTVQLLFVAPAAVILAGLYLWRRDIICNMLAHFITDGMGFLAPH